MTKASGTVSVSFLPATARRLGVLASTLIFSSAALAQVQAPVVPHHHGMGNTGVAPANTAVQQPGATGKPSAAIPAAGATNAAAAPTQPVSQLQEPPKQAVIETHADNLTIRADNASLTQTLQRIADKTGMHLEGISGDQRVFGDFGPGAPRDVLSTLLNGTGYNVVMIGALDNGAPRQLILSQKKTSTSGQAASEPRQQQTFSPADDDSGDPPPDDQPPSVPPPHGGPDGTGPGIRTPQQMLQQMQQMRQQADQQQAAQPQ